MAQLSLPARAHVACGLSLPGTACPSLWACAAPWWPLPLTCLSQEASCLWSHGLFEAHLVPFCPKSAISLRDLENVSYKQGVGLSQGTQCCWGSRCSASSGVHTPVSDVSLHRAHRTCPSCLLFLWDPGCPAPSLLIHSTRSSPLPF